MVTSNRIEKRLLNDETSDDSTNNRFTPSDHLTLDDSVKELLAVVLDTLTVEERVAFILHDVFGVGALGVSRLVGRTTAETVSLARSARRQIRVGRRPDPSFGRQHQIAVMLLRACETRDEHAVQKLLHPSVTVLVDSGGHTYHCMDPVMGTSAAATVLIQVFVNTPALVVSEQTVSGEAGLVFSQGEQVIAVWCINVVANSIANIWIVTNPEKLRSWNKS